MFAYNNAEFSEEDWLGIRLMYASVKEEDALKVGRFGLGFKSVFHMTGKSRVYHIDMTHLDFHVHIIFYIFIQNVVTVIAKL